MQWNKISGIIGLAMIIFSSIHSNHDLCDATSYIKIKKSMNHVSITPISRHKEHQRAFWWFKNYVSKYRILTDLIPGKFKSEPRTGTLLMKPMTTGKKPLG